MKQFMITQEFIDYFKENKRLIAWEVGEIIEERAPFDGDKVYIGVSQAELLIPKEINMLKKISLKYKCNQRFEITEKFKKVYPDDFQQGRIVTIVGLYKNAVVLATVYKAVKYPLSVLSLLT